MSQSCSRYAKHLLPPSETRKVEGIYHTVQKKETLFRICKTYNASLQEVAELNNIKSTSQIKIGDRIFIPGAKKVLQVSLSDSEKDKTSSSKIIKNTGMFIWPVNGRIIEEYGIYGGLKHDGINIESSAGTPVKAANDGNVVFSANLEGYGHTIIIQHKDNYATVYANNKVNVVKQGDTVKQGHKIAEVGVSNKNKSQAYLHFQIRNENQPRNPMFYLPHGT
ncbi:MAG: LysM peptidoglycan-binding domain-containing M23 family metallopeptidase [Pseudomonadota bacterium]